MVKKPGKPVLAIIFPCIVIFLAAFFLLPFMLFGTNSIVTIHDNLDQMIPYYKMYKDNDLFFRFDVPTKGFSEMSTLYYGHVNFSLTPLLYFLFDDFIAYTINIYICIFLSFFSMYFLLKKIVNINTITIIFVSLCYSILPVGPNLGICVSTLPLIIVIFIYFMSQSQFSWKILLILLYPFFSTFTMTGIFICGFWFLGLVILGIKDKRLNPNLLVGFVLLCIGYILVDLRLFYVMFILKTPLNRSVFNIYPVDSIEQVKIFLRTLKEYFLHGYYHASSFQRKIIVPFAFLVSVFCLFLLVRTIIKKPGKMFIRIREAVMESSIHIKLLFILEFTVFTFSIIAALYDSGLLSGFFKRYIPILSGFNWGRVWIFNRVLWYVIFAICLQFILGIKLFFPLKIQTDSFLWEMSPTFITRLCAGILICCQLLYISLNRTDRWQPYDDQFKTWYNEIIIKKGIRNIEPYISYKEFFAVDLFEKIKKDISYSDERVVAFGYHPSVLMYNGFNCIDGYNNAYPLSYMRRFRTLIAPELEINQRDREYYDSWGGRMYLYNSELDYQPTRDKNTTPVKLNIDMEVFRNDFEGRYILSRAEISNSDTLGLELVNRYYDEESIYTIYLYQTR